MILTPQELFYTIDAMHRYGGSFVSALASALECADGRNRQRILDNFPEIFADYGPSGPFYRWDNRNAAAA